MVRGVFDGYVERLVDAALRGADEKLALDPVVLDMRRLVDSFDALVLTSGASDRQVRAIADEIERAIAVTTTVHPLRVEGLAQAQWIALDYGDVIVHVFDLASRDYYDLEHLWSAAPALRAPTR